MVKYWCYSCRHFITPMHNIKTLLDGRKNPLCPRCSDDLYEMEVPKNIEIIKIKLEER